MMRVRVVNHDDPVACTNIIEVACTNINYDPVTCTNINYDPDQ